ncbi:MAG: Do family serine endopeptidase [Thiolinea sp.]
MAFARGLPEFAELVKANGPAVVNVSTSRSLKSKELLPEQFRAPPGSEELFDELMKKFFGGGEGDGGGLPFDDARGSGFILSADGYVVTNHHVVADADEITVKLNDRREFPAKLIGSDERSDVALLKIDATGLPTLKMGDSSDIQVGEWVLAIGSPFGFESSATSGIVSATGRSLPSDSYVPFIQTDVAINPGNSGGPLFNLDGEVIGINSQIYSRSGGFMGVSFAIPINMAMDVIGQIKDKGKVSRGWIGVFIQEVDQNLARSFGMLRPSGALVAEVIKDGPAVKVLQEGDVIVAFNGRDVPSAAALPSIVGAAQAGQTVKLAIMRDKARQEVELVIGELPDGDKLASRRLGGGKDPEPEEPQSIEVLGMSLLELDDVAREAMDISRGGVLVERVTGDPARKAGILAGDVITMLDGKSAESPGQLARLVKDLEKDKTVAVLVHRDGAARFLAMKVE